MDSENKTNMLCDCKKSLKKLCSARVKDSLELSMSVTSADGDTCFEKRIRSDSDFNLMKTIGVSMLVFGGFSLICALCSFLKK